MLCANGWKRCERKNAAPDSGLEDFTERNFDIRVFSSQDPIENFVHLARRVAEGALRERIEDPDVANAHPKIIRQFLVEPSNGVYLRKNLDAEERRAIHDWIAGI